MQEVLILEYQIYVELAGPVRVGDVVSWGVDTRVDDFYGPANAALTRALYFDSDVATADDDDEPPETQVAGEVKEIRAVWCRRNGSLDPTPGTVVMVPCSEVDRETAPRPPEHGLHFEGYLVSVG